MMEVHRQSGGFTPPVVAKRTSRYRGSVAPGDGTGVGQNDRTGVNSFSACLLAKNDRIGRARLDLVNQGHACYSTGVRRFFKQGYQRAPLTHKEGGAFLFYLRRVTLAMSLLKERINLLG